MIPVDLVDRLESVLGKVLSEGGVQSIWIEVRDKVFCGKIRCKKCSGGFGHPGPYYYLHYRIKGRNKTVYLGKARTSKLVSYDEIILRQRQHDRTLKPLRVSYDNYPKTSGLNIDNMLQKYCSNCPLFKDQNGKCEYMVKGFCGAVKFAEFLKKLLRQAVKPKSLVKLEKMYNQAKFIKIRGEEAANL